MQFENSFVDNYIYNENNDTISGGYPINLLAINEDLDAKFDNMSIPAGLVVTKNIDKLTGGYNKHYKTNIQSIVDLIDNDLFDNLINKISFKSSKNTTRKNNNGGSHNVTKKSK
jgi:hypothetical protein